MKQKFQEDFRNIKLVKILSITAVMFIVLVIVLAISLAEQLSKQSLPVIITICCIAVIALILNIVCCCLIGCTKWNTEWVNQNKTLYAILSAFTFIVGEVIFTMKAFREVKKAEIEYNKQSKQFNNSNNPYKRK